MKTAMQQQNICWPFMAAIISGLILVALPARAQILTDATPFLQLEADLGVTTSGGNVTAWADQSGNGNNVSQATSANQPVLISGATPSGLPAISFNNPGTTQELLTASNIAAQTNLTFFIVAATHVNQASYVVTFGNSVHAVIENFQGTGDWTSFSGSETVLPPLGRPLDTYSIISDGGVGSASAVSSVLGPWRIGSYAGTSPYDGSIAEVLVYNTALSSADVTTVDNYLTAKWITPAPEPASVALIIAGAGVLSVACLRRRGPSKGSL